MQAEEMKSVILAGGSGSSTRVRLDAPREPLLPGIPNDITLDQITPKLPWRTFYILSTVSPVWLHAIRSHLVYNARVRANSTETLALVKYYLINAFPMLGLYCRGDNSRYELPLRKRYGPEGGFDCHFVTIDAKIYFLEDRFLHVMDLASQDGWKPCATPPAELPWRSACGVLHGKIYAFGIRFGYEHFCQSYDPEKNIWSPIKSTYSRRIGRHHKVTKVGEELLVHGFEYLKDNRVVACLKFYHPIKNEWRVVEYSEGDCREVEFFSTKGKLYSISNDGICGYDICKNSWTHVHSHTFSAIPKFRYGWLEWDAAETVDDEVLATVTWVDRNSINTADWVTRRTCLILSNGFGGGNEEISWQEPQCSPPFPDWPPAVTNSGIYLIQL